MYIVQRVIYSFFTMMQILMSVQQKLIHAIKGPLVWTQMEVTPVHVTVDTLEMGKFALVQVLVHAAI